MLEEDFQGPESASPRVETYTRAVPSWKVGLANKEQKQAKAAAKDVEQKLNEAITTPTVRLVSVDGERSNYLFTNHSLSLFSIVRRRRMFWFAAGQSGGSLIGLDADQSSIIF